MLLKNKIMKNYFFCLTLFFLFSKSLKAQAVRYPKIEGLYKLYTKSHSNDSVFRGYINFYQSNEYYFFGKTGYNKVGVRGNNFIMFSNGSWNINKSNIIIIKDRKNGNPVNAYNNADSIIYEANLKQPFDSNFFKIQVFDNFKKPLKNVLINFKSINRLLESDSVGILKYSLAKSGDSLREKISFITAKPHYPAIIDINPNFNYHSIKVFLRGITENGYIQDYVYSLSLTDSLIHIDSNSIKLRKNVMYKVSKKEVSNYLDLIQKSNLYFYKEFSRIKTLLLK